MKARSLGAVFPAILLSACLAFAQTDNSNMKNNNQDPNASTGVQGNVQTGKVTKYTPNQSITIRESNGTSRDFDLNNATANVDPAVKVGSRVRISETNNNGQRTIRVEPMTSQRAGTSGSKLPKTASDEPLLVLIGLGSLGAAAAVRFGRKRTA